MIGRAARIRVRLILTPEKPLVFIAQATDVYNALKENAAIITSPSPTLTVLSQQIQDASAAQQSVGKVKGAAATRNAKFKILFASLQSEKAVIQGLCDNNPDQAELYISAAGMLLVDAVGKRQKPLLALQNGPSGSVNAEANATLLDSSRRKKSYNWRYTLDGGKSFVSAPSTPVGRTVLGGLTALVEVGVQVSVTVNKQPPGAWSQTVTILVR